MVEDGCDASRRRFPFNRFPLLVRVGNWRERCQHRNPDGSIFLRPSVEGIRRIYPEPLPNTWNMAAPQTVTVWGPLEKQAGVAVHCMVADWLTDDGGLEQLEVAYDGEDEGLMVVNKSNVIDLAVMYDWFHLARASGLNMQTYYVDMVQKYGLKEDGAQFLPRDTWYKACNSFVRDQDILQPIICKERDLCYICHWNSVSTDGNIDPPGPGLGQEQGHGEEQEAVRASGAVEQQEQGGQDRGQARHGEEQEAARASGAVEQQGGLFPGFWHAKSFWILVCFRNFSGKVPPDAAGPKGHSPVRGLWPRRLVFWTVAVTGMVLPGVD